MPNLLKIKIKRIDMVEKSKWSFGGKIESPNLMITGQICIKIKFNSIIRVLIGQFYLIMDHIKSLIIYIN